MTARVLRIWPYTVGRTFIPSVIADVLETLGGASTVLPLLPHCLFTRHTNKQQAI